MQTLFENVLRASLYGSVIIACLLLLRPLLKKLPKKYLCLLWLLAFLRLLMPFEIQFNLSLQPDMETLTRQEITIQPTPQTLPEPVPAVPEDAAMPEDVEASYADAFTPPESIPEGLESYYPPVVEETEPVVINWNAIGFAVWAAVACGLVVYSIVSLLRLRKNVREAVRCRDGAWECAGLETAFILGWLRPRVYLPMGLSGDTRHHILRHEKAHLSRKDHWLKLLGFLALAVHWFNPLVWVAWVLLCRDMELACDEQVVKDMGLSERKDYSAALLRCSTRKEHYLACPVAFGEVSVRQRILSVLNYRRPRFWISLAGIVTILFVAVFFMTSPAEEEPDLSFLNYKNAVSLAAEQKKVMAIYCVEGSICPGEVYGDDLAKLLDSAQWRQRKTEPRDQSSPGSIEFILEEDHRITLFDRKFARVNFGEEVRYYRIPGEDYEAAVRLLTDPVERELTEEEILIERCQSAMEAIMYADAYHIKESADLAHTPALQSYYEAEYWKSYDNRMSRWYPDDDISTAWRMEWNGKTYKKQEEDNPYDWREEEFIELDESRLRPWFHFVDWNRDSFTVEHHEVSGDTEEITLHHTERDFYQHEYTMTFLLDKNGKLLRIDRNWVKYQGKECAGIYTTEFVSFDPEEVAGNLEQVVESYADVFAAAPQAAWPGYDGTMAGYEYFYTSEREKKWEEDILYLAEAMLTRHPLLHDGNSYIYSGIGYEEVAYSDVLFDPELRQTFLDGINQLIPQLGWMSDERIPFEINRVMALVGDENTVLACDPRGVGLPLSLEPIWNGDQVSYHIVRIPQEHENLIFGEVTAINGISMEEITNCMRCYVAYSNEDWVVRWLTGMDTYSYVTTRGALEAAGVVSANAVNAEITVRTETGTRKVSLPFLTYEEQTRLSRVYRHLYGTDLLPYRYLDEKNVWCETLENAVYLQIVELPSDPKELEQELNKAVRALQEAETPAKLIIDLRLAGGGNDMVSRFQSFADRVNDLQTDGVYLLIDSLSRYHGTVTAYRLKHWIEGAVLVGTSTGDRLNHFVFSTSDSLPNSGISFGVKEKYAYLDASLGNGVLQPDVLVQQTLEDYKQGIDTVLQYVLSADVAPAASTEDDRTKILEQSELLQRCYDALAWHQVQSSRHTRLHVFYTGRSEEEAELTAEYWQTPTGKLRKLSIEGREDGWLAEQKDTIYCLGIQPYYPGDVTDYTQWVEAVNTEENVMTTWLEEYKWDFSQIEFLRSQQQGDRTVITFRVNEPLADNQGGAAEYHDVTFCLSKDNHLLWMMDNYAILGTQDGDATGYIVSAEIQVLTYDEKLVGKRLQETLEEIRFPY